MRMSGKMILLFSFVTAILIALNTLLTISTELRSLQSREEETLTALAQQMSGEIEQNISFMEYGIESMTQNIEFMAALATINRLGEDGASMDDYIDAQNTLASYLYVQPIIDRFYSINVITNSGFILSSHFQKFEVVESYSDDLLEQLALIPWIADESASLSAREIATPHADPWNVYHSQTHSVSVYTMWSRAVYHGEDIGYLEVNALSSDLEGIFEVPAMNGFFAAAIYENRTSSLNRELYRGSGNTIVYEGVTPGSMVTCTDESGTSYYVVSAYNKALDLTVYAAQRTDEFVTTVQESVRSHIQMGLILLAATILVIVVLSFTLTRSVNRLTAKIVGISSKSLVESGRLEAGTPLKVTAQRDREVRILEDSFDKMLLALQTFTQTEMELRESTLRAQLNALQAQINPHFIYNTLNIISAKSMEAGNEAVIDICDHFAQMLRYSTDLRSKTATLAEEIENAKHYLLLAKFRYEDKLTYTIDVPGSFMQKLLPKLSLQPIIENAISHGYQGSRGVFSVSISGKTDAAGRLHLTVRDSGCGFDENVLLRLRHEFQRIESGELSSVEDTGAHIGLVNTYRRLYYFSEKRILMLLRNDGGAVVEMVIGL